MIQTTRLFLIALLTAFSASSFCQTSYGQEGAAAAEQSAEAQASEQDELFEKLADYLTKSKWKGKFSITGRDNADLTEEAYYILSAEKMKEGDYWKLVARIKYGTHDLTVPLPLEIKWADETPVITVDQMAVPGLGTFDARVLIRNGKYSGTWAHDQVGGHLFGTIEPMSEEEIAEVEEAAKKKDWRNKNK